MSCAFETPGRAAAISAAMAVIEINRIIPCFLFVEGA